jgi:hypothetical protein
MTASASQAALAMNRPDAGQVRQSGALELGDGLLDDRVPAVVGLDFSQREVPVGDERVVVPGGEQRELAAGGGPDPAHDQPDLTGVPLVAREHNTVNVVSAMSAPETSGVLSQYGIGCHTSSGIAIATRTRLSCQAVMENWTSNFAAVARTALN